MWSITVVSVLSFLCSMVQLLYICSMLWMLRVRRLKMRRSQVQMPVEPVQQPAIAGQQQQQQGGAKPADSAHFVVGSNGAADADAPNALSLTHAGYYNDFLPSSFHSVPPAKGAAAELHDAAAASPHGFSADADSVASGGGGGSLASADSPSDSALALRLGAEAADHGRISMPSSFGSNAATSPTAAAAQAAAAAAAAAAASATRGTAGATPYVRDGAMYDEEDPFRAGVGAGGAAQDVPASAAAADAAESLAVAREAAAAHNMRLATSPAAPLGAGPGSGGSARSASALGSTSSLRHSSILEGDEGSMSLSTASRFRPKSASQNGLGLGSSAASAGGEDSRGGYSPLREDMQVSLDADDLSQPNQLVELVLDDEQADDPASPPTLPGEGRAIRLEASRSPQVRSDPTSMQTMRVLHVSAAPFSQPEHHHQSTGNHHTHAHAHDSYSLMVDAPLGSSAYPHPQPHQQSRMIAHPKSLSYNRFEHEQHALHNALTHTDPFAAPAAAAAASSSSSTAAGISGAASAPSTPAFGSSASHQSSSSLAQKRRASLTRKFGVPSTSASSGGVPIPRPVASKYNALDPNASPIRAKVKFLDSPRDRDRASMEALRAAGRAGAAANNSGGNSNSNHLRPSSSVGFSSSGSGADDKSAALIPRERQPRGTGAAGGGSNGTGTLKSILVPPSSEREKNGSSSCSSSSSLAPLSNLLVLPVYYRFLIQHTIHCSLWTLACLVLLAFGTNLVQWGSTHPASGSSGSDSDGDNPGWLFSSVLAFLLGVHALVLDGILVFLSSRSVGRAAIKFSAWFSGIWGTINAVTVLVVSMTVHVAHAHRDRLGHVIDDRLAPTHPFFVRSCLALALNLFISLSPRWLVCDARARRSNYGRKSMEEREAALARQQARWDALADASVGGPTLEGMEDTFDNDPDAYDDETAPRNTWLILALWNSLFHCLVLLVYALDFARVAHDDPLWSTLLLILLALGFVLCTPVLVLALQRDSQYWQSEWMNALRRMKASSELEELDRVRREQEAIDKARAAGLEAEAQLREQQLRQPKAPSAYLSFYQSSESNFFIDYNLVQYGPLLGSGGFSSVYSAKLGGSGGSKRAGLGGAGGLDVAVKVLHVRDLTKEVVEQFLHEVGIVLQLHHPNIVHFLGVVFSPPDMVLVMERCRAQSLLSLIKHEKIKFTEFQAVSIALAIADALRYIHEQDILHRDLKAANILFDKEGRPKLCDFGLSEERSKIDLSRVFCGTLAYMSPEVLRSETVGKASDVYSFSIIFWELLHNELAWKRGKTHGGGLNARVLVEMVAYRRARPPIKERLIDGFNAGGGSVSTTAAAAAAAVAGLSSSQHVAGGTKLPPQPTLSAAGNAAQQRPTPQPLPADAARIDLQAFAGAEPAASSAGGADAPAPSGGGPSRSRSAAAVASALANTPASSAAASSASAAAGSASSGSSARPGLHPVLVTLLREMWRDDYRRRPSFVQIVKRLTAFRELIRAQQHFK